MQILSLFFFFNDTATTEIYTLSLHDALPIYRYAGSVLRRLGRITRASKLGTLHAASFPNPDRERFCEPGRTLHKKRERSEEHTSELQSRQYLVCRLLLEKKNSRDARRRAGRS